MALQLIQAGYSRVSVVRGGFEGLVEAGVMLAPKPEGQPISTASTPREMLPSPAPGASGS